MSRFCVPLAPPMSSMISVLPRRSDCRPLLLTLPRIHHLGSQVGKVFDVSGCQLRSASDYNSCDLRVAHVDGSTIALSFSRETRGSFGCCAIEIQYSFLQILSQQLRERRFECLTASTTRQQRQAETRFEKCNACYPHRL